MIWFYPTVVSNENQERTDFVWETNLFWCSVIVLSTEVKIVMEYCQSRNDIPSCADCALHNSKVHCSHSGPFRLEWFSRRWQSISLTIGVAFSNSHKHAIWAKREGCNYTSGLCTSSYHWPELLKSVIFTDNYLQFSRLWFLLSIYLINGLTST